MVGRIGTANTVRAAGLAGRRCRRRRWRCRCWLNPFPGTAIALFFFGIGVGLWDVSQNIEGADVEHRLGRTIMPQFHAAFSGGAFLGALIGAGLSTLGVGLPQHLLVIAAVGGRADARGPAVLPAPHPAPDRRPTAKPGVARARRHGGTAAPC